EYFKDAIIALFNRRATHRPGTRREGGVARFEDDGRDGTGVFPGPQYAGSEPQSKQENGCSNAEGDFAADQLGGEGGGRLARSPFGRVVGIHADWNLFSHFQELFAPTPVEVGRGNFVDFPVEFVAQSHGLVAGDSFSRRDRLISLKNFSLNRSSFDRKSRVL